MGSHPAPMFMVRANVFGGIITIIALLILVMLVIFPLGILFYKSFETDRGLSLQNYAVALSDPRNLSPLKNTLLLGAWTIAIAVFIGVPLAWLVVRTDLPGRNLAHSLCLLPYMLPPFIGAIAWIQLLAPRVGLVNRLWSNLFHTESSLFNIYSSSGMTWVMGLYAFPFVFLATKGALERMNPSLEEAARISGAGRFKVMKDITLPLVVPSILSGVMLAFLYTLTNFGVPALLGMRARIFVLTTRIYSYVHRGDFSGIRLATALSVLLVVMALAIHMLNQWIIRRQHGAAIISGKSVRPTIVELGQWRWPLGIIVHTFLLFSIVLPFVALFLTSFLRAWGVSIQWSNLTLRNYRYVLFEYPLTRRAITNSLVLGLTSATLTVIIGGILAYLSVKTQARGRKFIDLFCTLPNAIPATVVALAMILTYSGRFGINFYNSLAIILVAYLAHYLFYAFRNISASLIQIHPSLEEAARVSGADRMRAFRDVIVPLVRPGLAAGWALVFMPTVRELTMSILLYGPNTPTIGVAVYELQEAGYFHLAAALSCVIVVILFAVNLVANRAVKLLGRL